MLMLHMVRSTIYMQHIHGDLQAVDRRELRVVLWLSQPLQALNIVVLPPCQACVGNRCVRRLPVSEGGRPAHVIITLQMLLKPACAPAGAGVKEVIGRRCQRAQRWHFVTTVRQLSCSIVDAGRFHSKRLCCVRKVCLFLHREWEESCNAQKQQTRISTRSRKVTMWSGQGGVAR